MTKQIFCIPGFLGEKKDFDFLLLPHEVVELFTTLQSHESLVPFSAFAPFLHDKVISHPTSNPIGFGYSLGGRLLLHAAISYPTLFSKLVIISSHPGLTSNEEKTARLIADRGWASRFQNDTWDDVINAWNSQNVLSGSGSANPHPKREESLFSKKALVHALTEWSLGKQEDLSSQIAALPMNILWIVGENDSKFKKIAFELSKKAPNIQLKIIPEAGHRVMWEKPEVIDTLVRTYVEEN